MVTAVKNDDVFKNSILLKRNSVKNHDPGACYGDVSVKQVLLI